jgi:hypothetical protein
MARMKPLLLAVLGAGLLAAMGGCDALPLMTHLFTGDLPIVAVPPWTAEPIEERLTHRFTPHTPIMPPLIPGQPVPTCDDPPSDEEVIRALPKLVRGMPFIYEEFRDDFTVIVEKLVDRIDPCTYVPLLGPAQLHHCHFKCTVFYKEKKTSDYPFPFQVINDRVQVVYIDKDHFHLCVSPDDEAAQRSVSRDLR